MTKMRRIMTTISAQFNDLVDQVENHQAVTEAALRKFRSDIKEAKIQSRLLEKELDNAHLQEQKLFKEKELWQNRALEYHKTDRDKALECIKRMKLCSKEHELWLNRSQNLLKTHQNLKDQIYSVESQYQELKIKHQELLSREKSAHLKNNATAFSHDLEECDIQDAFNRWDKKIIRSEVESESDFLVTDNLSLEIEKKQEALELEATLDELVSDKNN